MPGQTNESGLHAGWGARELAEAMQAGLELRLLDPGASRPEAPLSWQPALTKRTLMGRLMLFVGPPVERLLLRLYGVLLGPWLSRQREMHRSLVQEMRTLKDEVAALREEVERASLAGAPSRNAPPPAPAPDDRVENG